MLPNPALIKHIVCQCITFSPEYSLKPYLQGILEKIMAACKQSVPLNLLAQWTRLFYVLFICAAVTAFQTFAQIPD